jgi:uncharacterized membrane protein YgaE (UPF0421/DUF939 family)
METERMLAKIDSFQEEMTTKIDDNQEKMNEMKNEITEEMTARLEANRKADWEEMLEKNRHQHEIHARGHKNRPRTKKG